MPGHYTRRGSIARLAGLAAAAAGGSAWKIDDADGAGPRALSSGLVSCILTPELTEGPYYVAGEKLRRDVTGGRPGTPLLLHLAVLGASSCRPVAGATVEIWHCDARGVYSGAVANNPGTNFLRGAQKTDASGVASFRTIYPGWYPGRAVHIHVKVHVAGNVVHTGQLFFPAAVTDAVYRAQPYRSHGTQPDTPNPSDAIFRNGGNKSILKVVRHGGGYAGSSSMGVHTA
jgi:Dioxygenase